MSTKQDIIDNIIEYSAVDLVKYIKDGVVTLKELCEETDGDFPASVRKEVQRMLDGSEDDDWQEAKKTNTEEAYLTFLKAYPESKNAEVARNAIVTLQHEHANNARQELWDSINKGNVDELRKFVKENPNDVHVKDAKKIINSVQKTNFLGFDTNALIKKIQEIKDDKTVNLSDIVIAQEIESCIDTRKISQVDLLGMIQKDNNVLSSKTINKLIEDGYIEYEELESIGIDRKFIEQLTNGSTSKKFASPKPLVKINKVSTEVYFWGIPSSGKTCALGAILSVANNGTVARSMAKDNDCQGYGYMADLSELFKSEGSVGVLPEGTPTTATYEMGFDLVDEKGAIHPITCIDLAGELMRCMFKSDANLPLNQDEVNALDTLTKILADNKTGNRKMHFFVLEYGGENRLIEDRSQSLYLDAALRYIERTRIFEKDTDAIYLMYTKVDKTGLVGEELIKELNFYTEKNYLGFYNGLSKLCKDFEINGGKVERIPFSLGEVCFQDYCIFKGRPAANVVNILLTRSKGNKRGRFQKCLNKLKG